MEINVVKPDEGVCKSVVESDDYEKVTQPLENTKNRQKYVF